MRCHSVIIALIDYKYISPHFSSGIVERAKPIFLLVYNYYYTEWLSLRRVLRPKFFTGIYYFLNITVY